MRVKISPELKLLKKLIGIEIVLNIMAASSFRTIFETIFCVIKIFIILKKCSLSVVVSIKMPISAMVFKFFSLTKTENIRWTILGVISPMKVKTIEIVSSVKTSKTEISFFKYENRVLKLIVVSGSGS